VGGGGEFILSAIVDNNDFQIFRSSINTLANRSSSCDVFDISPNGADCTITQC